MRPGAAGARRRLVPPAATPTGGAGPGPRRLREDTKRGPCPQRTPQNRSTKEQVKVPAKQVITSGNYREMKPLPWRKTPERQHAGAGKWALEQEAGKRAGKRGAQRRREKLKTTKLEGAQGSRNAEDSAEGDRECRMTEVIKIKWKYRGARKD